MGYVAITELKDGMTFQGLEVFVKEFETKPMQKKKQDYGTGLFEDKTGNISFKVWENDVVNQLKGNNIQNKVLSINGECAFSSYSNALEIKVTGVNGEVTDADMSLYIRTCDIEGNREKFNAFLNSHLSKPFASAVVSVLSQTVGEQRVFDMFKKEQAAHSMHDALQGGLMNHTLKMCRLAEVLVESDTRLNNYKDILYTGIILHDVGKVLEYSKGEKTNIGFVTHHVLGVELVHNVKAQIIKDIGEEAYYRVLSVIQGHHGEFGDRPTSIYAYIVHLIDMLDAKTTSIMEAIENKNYSTYGGNVNIKMDGYNLVV